MFSANENLILREHKRRVVSYIEDTIREEILDLGTTVMVMQTACRTPGCVPLETVLAIVFPRLNRGELIPGIKESDGGTFKTNILLPLSEVTRDDVLDALPPGFQGGRKTWERMCLQLRDLVFGRIGGLVGNGNEEVEDRRIMAEYLKSAMEDYLARDCKAPPLGQPFDDDDDDDDKNNSAKKNDNGSVEIVQGSMEGTANFIIRRSDSDDVTKEENHVSGVDASASASSKGTLLKQKDHHNYDDIKGLSFYESKPTILTNRIASSMTLQQSNIHMTENRSNRIIDCKSDQILERMSSERQHAPGVRRTGCPCCDPENIANVVESMLL
jgi:hypothetical protein